MRYSLLRCARVDGREAESCGDNEKGVTSGDGLHGWRVVLVDRLGYFFLDLGGEVSFDFAAVGLSVDGVAEFFGGLEEGDSLGGNVDALSSFGIAADAGFPLAGAKAAEAANLDLVAFLESADDGFEEGVDDYFPIATGEIAERGYLVDEVGLGHRESFQMRSMGVSARPSDCN